MENPNCLFRLGENKEVKLEDLLGPDPTKEAREKGSFVGLKVLQKFFLILFLTFFFNQNLGATCYMNSLLQVF